MYARERLDEAGEDAIARRAARRLGARARRASSATRRGSTATRRTCEPRSSRLLEREPRDALRLCIALLPFWLRRIDLHEAKRRFADALAAAPERTTLRAEALLAAAAIDFRSGTLAQGVALAEESLAVASEVGDTRAEWRALQFLGEFGDRERRGRGRGAAGSSVRSRSRDARASRPRRRSASTRSASPTGSLGDLTRADDLVGESIELFRALEGSPERIPSPLNIADVRMSQPDRRPG